MGLLGSLKLWMIIFLDVAIAVALGMMLGSSVM